jgi:hypothetical protein
MHKSNWQNSHLINRRLICDEIFGDGILLKNFILPFEFATQGFI